MTGLEVKKKYSCCFYSNNCNDFSEFSLINYVFCGCILSLIVVVTEFFDMEKPVVFTHEDILSSTDGFSDSNLLGHGAYGSVYYGLLRDQVYSF